MYKKCLKWARSHGSRFNPDKSELIHFTRKRKAVKASINLEGEIIKPSKSIRFLGAFIDEGLKYKAYLKTLNTRVPTLLSALKSITSSTWGVSLLRARTLYIGAIRPALAYGALSWYPRDSNRAKGLIKRLESI